MKRVVALDTSTLRQANFALEGAAFRLLAALAAQGVVEVVIPDIVLMEAEGVIREQCESALAAIKKASAEARIFGNLGLPQPWSSRDVPQLSEVLPQLVVALRRFFASPGMTILPASDRSGKAVFGAYFEGRPPFGTGRKKAEFPDAFALDALAAAAETRGVTIDLVSDDGDWEAFAQNADRFRCYKTLAEFLQEVQELPGATLARAAATFRGERENLQWAIADIITNQWITLADSAGEVLSLDVQGVTVEDPRVVTIDDVEDAANYSCRGAAQISFEARIPREESYRYDAEDRRGLYTEWRVVRLDRRVDLEIDFSLHLQGPRKVEFETTPIEINQGRPLLVYLDEDAASEWK